MDSFNDFIGEILLREHIQFAVLKDPVTQESYNFVRITDVEYQFGRQGDMLTNYVLGCNFCGEPLDDKFHKVSTSHGVPQYGCSNACADGIARTLFTSVICQWCGRSNPSDPPCGHCHDTPIDQQENPPASP